MTPDLIITNARILMMDATTPRAEAIALAAGRIAAVGPRAMISTGRSPVARSR